MKQRNTVEGGWSEDFERSGWGDERIVDTKWFGDGKKTTVISTYEHEVCSREKPLRLKTVESFAPSTIQARPQGQNAWMQDLVAGW